MKTLVQIIAFLIGTLIVGAFHAEGTMRVGDLFFGAMWGGTIAAGLVGAAMKSEKEPKANTSSQPPSGSNLSQ